MGCVKILREECEVNICTDVHAFDMHSNKQVQTQNTCILKKNHHIYMK